MAPSAETEEDAMRIQYGKHEDHPHKVIRNGLSKIEPLRAVHVYVHRIACALAQRLGDVLRQAPLIFHDKDPHATPSIVPLATRAGASVAVAGGAPTNCT